ncbi:MAG: PIN domain-containing protein [Planctomycetota bacterium]
MSGKHVFVDTNILVYAYDLDAGDRHDRAKRLVRELWKRPQHAWISVQVLQELYISLLRLGMPDEEVTRIVEDYLNWGVVQNTTGLLQVAIRGHQHWQISLWDAMILAAARQARATILWTEDLSDGRDYDGVVARKPLTAG